MHLTMSIAHPYWEYPTYNMGGQPTEPLDREHFSLLMKEIDEAFKKRDPPLLLTFAAAADPSKANNAYNLDEVHPYVDWLNVMAYDYHGGQLSWTRLPCGHLLPRSGSLPQHDILSAGRLVVLLRGPPVLLQRHHPRCRASH